MKLSPKPRTNAGFTVVELVLVIVIMCILGVLVAVTYSGVQADNRNNQRQTDIDVVQSQLETYFAQRDIYPSLGQLNDAAWRTENLKGLKEENLQDPEWSATGACAKNDKPQFADKPTEFCYAFQVSGPDGAACDNATVTCTQYTLTATLDSGETYVKTSLN